MQADPVIVAFIVCLRNLLLYLLGGSATDESVNLYLFNSSQSNGIQIPRGDYSKIDRTKEIVFIFHGFRSLWDDFSEVSQLHLRKNPDCLVINVDYEHLSNGINYVAAAKNAETVGNYVGEVMAAAKLNGSKVRAMGHSLGAHTAGFAGRRFTKLTGQKIREIIAPDPTRLLFGALIDFPHYLRLSTSDASVVVTLVTNRWLNRPTNDYGHVNFYVNNAMHQPGCEFPDFVCSHHYSVILYNRSILEPVSKGVRMESWSPSNEPVGSDPNDTLWFLGDVPVGKTGLYHFNTV